MTYKLVVDMGKPFEQIFTNEKDLFKYLIHLRNMGSDFPYLDIFIYDYMTNEDITELIFERLDDNLSELNSEEKE
jgi:hypothetical protein